MTKTHLLQEIRHMRFEDIYGKWRKGRLSQAEAGELLGVCERTFRRWSGRYEEEGFKGLADRSAVFHAPLCLARYNADGSLMRG